MDISADALDIVCKHLDARSIVQLAGTNKETRKHVLASRHLVFDPVPFVNPSLPVIDRMDFRQRVIRSKSDATSAAWCPQSKRVAYGLTYGQVVIYDCESAKELYWMKGHHESVLSVHWSPDGTKVVSASGDYTLRIWDATTGRQAMLLRVRFPSYCASWSPDGTRIVSGSIDNTIRVWNAETGHMILLLRGHESDVTCVAWSLDSTKVVSGSFDQTVRIWSADTGASLHVLRGHRFIVWSIAWCPDGSRIVSCSEDHTMRIWNAHTGESVHVIPFRYGVPDWSPDGSRLATVSADETMSIWDTRTWVKTHTWRGITGNPSSVAWSPDGTKIVSTSNTRMVRVWNVACE